MSNIDLEDLIATLNTHHIGSEQLDLANLQAQLRQILQAQATPFPTSPVQIACGQPGGGPTNTPTARTPSWSHLGDSTHTLMRRNNSIRTRQGSVIPEEPEGQWHNSDDFPEGDRDMMEDVEEEAEVDSLCGVAYPPPTQSPAPGNSPNAYASTDPFLAAQLRAAECRQPSIFAQIATAQQHTSPFYTAAQSASSMFPLQTPQGTIFVPGPEARPMQLKVDTACIR